MRWGCCGTLEQAREIKDAGFDFLEVNVQAVLKGDEPSSTWDRTAPDPARFPLPIEAANCLVPGNRPIIGPGRDLAALEEYMKRVASRAQRLGMSRLVFGSGGARRRPDSVDPEMANEHLVQFTRMAGEVCAHHGIVLVIEHLNRKECNTINRLAEARALCDEVGHPNVCLLVDSYHFGLENDSEEAVLEMGALLKHVHVAEVVGRVEPGAKLPQPGEPFDFVDFFCLLRKVGYDERVCIEAGAWTGSLATAGPRSLQYLRSAWDKAGKAE